MSIGEENMLETDYECSAILNIVSSTQNSREISEALGVEPTKAWNKGDVITPKISNVRKQTMWRYEVKKSGESPVSNALSELLDFVDTIAPRIEKLRTENSCQIWIPVYTKLVTTHILVEPETIARLNEIGLPVWFEIYPLTPDT